MKAVCLFWVDNVHEQGTKFRLWHVNNILGPPLHVQYHATIWSGLNCRSSILISPKTTQAKHKILSTTDQNSCHREFIKQKSFSERITWNGNKTSEMIVCHRKVFFAVVIFFLWTYFTGCSWSVCLSRCINFSLSEIFSLVSSISSFIVFVKIYFSSSTIDTHK
jgi:hypothetical protein